MPEYAGVYLNKEDSAHAGGSKYARTLNMVKFWVWQGVQYAYITQSSEYARICRDRVLNISQVLNMSRFRI